MIESSHYLERVEKVCQIDTPEKKRLQLTDDATKLREIGRLVTGVCFAILAVASFFNTDLTIPSTITIIAVTYWFALSCVTYTIEPKTISLVERYEKKALAST